MSERIDVQNEEDERPDRLTGIDAVGVLAVVAFLGAVSLITFLLTSAIAI